jgi:transcriptional regulator with XRE-family HTH domain
MDAQGFRIWRQRRGFTQERAAAELGVTRRVVTSWEISETSIPPMVELAVWALEQGRRLKS